MKKIVSAIFGLISIGSLSTAYAALEGWQINGFLSIGTAWSDVDYLASGVEPVYNSYIRKRPSFEEDSDVGIQITKQLREDLSITTQLLAEASREWDIEAAWAFIKWEANDLWQFRVGRIRTNPYMFSDVVNVGYAYPWIRPPEEVYSMIPSSFSNATGGDIRFRHGLWHRDLTLIASYGAISTHLDFPSVIPNAAIEDTIRLRLRDLWACNIKYGDEIFSVRAGYQTTRVNLDPNSGSVMESLNQFLNALATGIPPFFPPFISSDYVNYFNAYNSRTSFMGVGYQFDWKNVVSMGELVKRKASSPIIASVIGWYLMGGYHVKQVMPHVTFARERVEYSRVRRFNGFINGAFMSPPGTPPFFIGADAPVSLDTVALATVNTSSYFEGGAGSQTSVTLGIRWDVYDGVAIKGEYKHVHPDFYSPGLFNVNPMESVNIYSLAVDAVM